MESWLDLESDGELEEHVEAQFGAEGSQDPHAVSPFEDQEKSEDNVASEPCKAEGAGSCEADREVNAEELPEVAAVAAKAETAESQEDVEEAPVNDAENDKEMSEDSFMASEPKDAQLAEAPRDGEPQLAELAAVEDVENREVQVRVEEVDYEESNSDGELLEEDAKSVATEAESEEAASTTSAAPEDVEDANTSDQNSESGRSIKSTERRRHKRRRRSSHHGHHGHRRRRRRHHSGHERSRRRSSQGRRKRMKTEKDHGPGGGPAAKQPQQSTLAPRGQREVYVGGLCWKDADKEGIAETFNSAFEALPDYQKRYSHETRKPVLQVHYPKDIIRKAAVGMRGDFAVFVFVEFVDEVLARTALKLTGLRIAQRSVRVCSTVGIELEGETLDVEPLRQWEKLPLRPRDGTTMLLNVWLGGLPMRLCREELQRQRSGTELSNDETLESRICTAVLALPGVKLRYPQMEKPIVALRVSECQRYLFVEAATELIASSMVAARGLSLPGGLEATTGWPVAVIDAEERAPPPLAEDGSLCDPSQVAALVQKAVVCEEDFAERLDCEIFMGGTNCLEVEDLWKALTELLMDLPDYKKQFPDLSLPVINLRTAHAPYAFARLAHPRLASTAVAIGEMFVRSRKVQLKRPTHCELQTFAPPLDVIRPSLLPPPPPRTPPRTPQRDRRGGTGPEFPALPKAPPRATEPGAAAGTAPPTPPKVPLNRRPQGTIQRIWIGNLPGREKMLEMIDPEEDEKQENKGDGIEMMKRLVDRRVNELAMEMPNYDVEDGPLTKRVTVHPTGRYAFIRVVGDQDFVEELLDVLDGKDFMGKPLRVNWAREKEDFWWQKKLRGTKPGVPRYVLQLPKGLQQLIAPETETLRTEEVVTNAPPKVLEIDEL